MKKSVAIEKIMDFADRVAADEALDGAGPQKHVELLLKELETMGLLKPWTPENEIDDADNYCGAV